MLDNTKTRYHQVYKRLIQHCVWRCYRNASVIHGIPETERDRLFETANLENRGVCFYHQWMYRVIERYRQFYLLHGYEKPKPIPIRDIDGIPDVSQLDIHVPERGTGS